MRTYALFLELRLVFDPLQPPSGYIDISKYIGKKFTICEN